MRFYYFRRVLDDIRLGFLFNILSCPRRFLLSLYPPSKLCESRRGSQFIENGADTQDTQYPICVMPHTRPSAITNLARSGGSN
ncbi:MAG: hypothetical protein WAK66_18795, partial [Methylocystis sp.]